MDDETSKKPLPIVVFLPASVDACALFRMFIPHLNTPGSRFVLEPGQLPWSQFIEASVAVVQRQVSANNLVALQQMRQAGIKLVYDLDDNLWAIPAHNPASRTFKDMREGFGVCAQVCDVITVSTRGLKTAVYAALGHNIKQEVIVVPNAMDFNLFSNPSTMRCDNKVIIGWAGSNTHSEDVTEAWPILIDVIRENENAYLEVVGGALPPKELQGHERVTMRPWVPVGEYPARIATWAWDIVLAPLEDNRFNKSKSCLKLLEAAAMCAACLVSDVQPYTDFCALGDDKLQENIVCRSKTDWKNKLSSLVQDVDKRRMVAREIRRITEEFYNISTIKENWARVFKQVA